ncbi:tetratricopeptide repeat protein [Clostridium sp. LBM24168]
MVLKDRRSRIPLKIKAVIFAALSVIVIIIAVNTAAGNRKSNVKTSSQTQKYSIKNKEHKDDKNIELESQYKQAESLFRSKQYANSIIKADKIIDQNVKFYKAYNIKGIALCYNNNYEEGMKNIDKSLELKPNYGYARFNKALAYELYGKYNDALIWYDKNLEVENYVWSYYGKASIYGRRGDVSNTVKYLKIALDMSPEIKGIARDEKDFDPVKNSVEFQELIK